MFITADYADPTDPYTSSAFQSPSASSKALRSSCPPSGPTPPAYSLTQHLRRRLSPLPAQVAGSSRPSYVHPVTTASGQRIHKPNNYTPSGQFTSPPMSPPSSFKPSLTTPANTLTRPAHSPPTAPPSHPAIPLQSLPLRNPQHRLQVPPRGHLHLLHPSRASYRSGLQQSTYAAASQPLVSPLADTRPIPALKATSLSHLSKPTPHPPPTRNLAQSRPSPTKT
ncbi:hypothetical protein BJ508DRAFT_333595 [Ascobolus immersus RN42]|uniref:Uncharacterized protein n=1 Tax=Ascobolus immersus RN42 TaxID=1160509 RepID=A0A3N4HN21_ASCIM|nr:hypothetical protein BJ508DRAFT_333595 [Ascobolus immersus RN42]